LIRFKLITKNFNHMKSTLTKIIMLLFVLALFTAHAHAQGSLIRRVQDRTEQKIVKEVFGDQEKQQQNQNNNEPANQAQNRRGGGLSQNVPDVLENIKQANDSYTAANYIQAKTAARNALWGIELEIGKKVLQTLPPSVEGLACNQSDDRVTSTGIGFAGLVIERIYNGREDMQLKATIGNDAALLGLAGFYMMGETYQTSDQQNHKQIQYKGQRATIKYDEYEGYTLGVPFGQSSVFVINGVNFSNETQFMTAANTFDLDKIKKELGEQ
jgi:hypothetical protein